MTLRHYCILIGLLTELSCQNELPPFAPSAYLISSYENATAQRHFDQCSLRYAFRNGSKTINIANSQKSLEAPFDQWQQANGFIDFTRVAANEPADISFVFSDSLQPTNARTNVGLIRQPVGVLSQLTKQADGTYTVYLLNSHRWDIGSLQRVLLFQIGAALGLTTSANPESAMSHRITTTSISLDSADINAVQQLYRQPCDEWTRLADLPFNARYIETAVAALTQGFVLLDPGTGQNALWEFTPAASPSWRSRKPYPITRTDSYGISPNRLAFAIDDRLYFGDSYDTNWLTGKTGGFWRYELANSQTDDSWKRVANLPQIGYGTGRSSTVNGKGYLVQMYLNSSSRERVVVSVYDPLTDSWHQPTAFERPSHGVYDLGETFSFVLNQQAYLVAPNGSAAKSWLFDPSQPNIWTEIAKFNPLANTPLTIGLLSKTGFAVRGAGYGISGSANLPKEVWQYKPEIGWKRMKDFNGQGSLMFSFVVGNRAFVSTSTGQFWMYRP